VSEPIASTFTDCPTEILRTAIVEIRDVAIPSPIALLAFMTT
jgi:hypothetical protein